MPLGSFRGHLEHIVFADCRLDLASACGDSPEALDFRFMIRGPANLHLARDHCVALHPNRNLCSRTAKPPLGLALRFDRNLIGRQLRHILDPCALAPAHFPGIYSSLARTRRTCRRRRVVGLLISDRLGSSMSSRKPHIDNIGECSTRQYDLPPWSV